MPEIYAKVLADSVAPCNVRLTTLEICAPRIILAEINTHRELSRNFRSSRAVPFAKLVREVLDDPFVPLEFGANQKGMVMGSTGTVDQDKARFTWQAAARQAATHAYDLEARGVHKNLCNRLIEPFMMTYGVISATAWEHLLHQREHPSAEVHFRALAEAIHSALAGSRPDSLEFGRWHLPYISDAEWEYMGSKNPNLSLYDTDRLIDLAKISAARCARVSYKPFDAEAADMGADLRTYAKLVERIDYDADPGHWSPLEHPSMALGVPLRAGNFTGWLQLRKIYPQEYRAQPVNWRVL
jgi:thymidylate synthase ThyX